MTTHTGHEHAEATHDHGHGHNHEHDHGHEHGSSVWSRIRHGVSEVLGAHSHDSADQVDETLEADADGRRALLLSLLILAVTAAIQAAVVLMSGSVALLGDTLHNVADALTAVPLLTDYLRTHAPSGDFVMVAPDTGRTKVAEQAARHAGEQVDVAAVYKRRPKDAVNQVEALDVMGDVEGRMCVLIDDMIDTAGTICAAAEILLGKGATEVWAMCTHPVLSDPATDRLKNSPISRVVVTDTLPLPTEKQIDKIEVVPIAKVIAACIDAVFSDGSVSQIFGGENQT